MPVRGPAYPDTRYGYGTEGCEVMREVNDIPAWATGPGTIVMDVSGPCVCGLDPFDRHWHGAATAGYADGEVYTVNHRAESADMAFVIMGLALAGQRVITRR